MAVALSAEQFAAKLKVQKDEESQRAADLYLQKVFTYVNSFKVNGQSPREFTGSQRTILCIVGLCTMPMEHLCGR